METSPHAYIIIPGYSKNPKNLLLISHIFLLLYFAQFVQHNFCSWCYFVFLITMAEANGICDLPKEGVQSILKGYSVNDSDRSLPQASNETLGLSSMQQNLSSSFNHLRRGITNCIVRNTNQPQNQAPMEVDTEQLSPTSLHTQLTAYQLSEIYTSKMITTQNYLDV